MRSGHLSSIDIVTNLCAVPRDYKIYGFKEIKYPIKCIADFKAEGCEKQEYYKALIGGYKDEVFTPLTVNNLLGSILIAVNKDIFLKDLLGNCSYIDSIVVSDFDKSVYFMWSENSM